MRRLKDFFAKHRQIILYLVFGAVTTVASLAACYLTLKVGVIFLHDENGNPTELLDVIGSSTQWVAGVLVAFITNKLWVFTDAEHGARSTFKQLAVFAGGRVFTYFLEVVVNLALIWAIEKLGYSPFTLLGLEMSSRVWAKLATSVIVVVVNYFISKLVVFKKKS